MGETEKPFKVMALFVLIIILSWLMVIVASDFIVDFSEGIEAFRNSYSMGKINNETVATFDKQYCNISYWKDDCKNMKHRIHSNSVIDLQELLHEQQDEEQREFVNCTTTQRPNGMIVEKCYVKEYMKKGTFELWWSNITVGKYSTMCYFIMEKQLDEDGDLVSNKDDIQSFVITKPVGIFSGYFKQYNTNGVEDYNLMLHVFRGVAPICVVEQYAK